MQTVCVQWPRLGPYHLARLLAAHERLEREGIRLIALETAGQDSTYEWEAERGTLPFQRVQVFPGSIFESIPPRIISKGVSAALDRLDPDAVAINSYSAPDAQAALAWSQRKHRPSVVLMESKADDAERSPVREWIKARIVQQFDAALAGGSPQIAYLEQLGFPQDYIFTPYDVVDNAFFSEGATAAREDPSSFRHLPGLDDRRPYFLASSRFVARKNLDTLLRAYASYRTIADAPWRLLLLGDGPERERLETIVAEERIEGVIFCGFRQIEELPAYYGFAGAFVHPALTEQWGLVVNEAMASGLPVLVSNRVGAAYDLVHHGDNGFTFDPENSAQLAHYMRQVADPETDRAAMGKCSKDIVKAWAPSRFGEGLWQAIQAGQQRERHASSLIARTLTWAMRTFSSDVKAFHSIKE